jgi:outer membrane protein OmpA-like peptidoglycan-associated protein
MHDGEKVLSLIGTRTTVSPRLENEAPLPQSFTPGWKQFALSFDQGAMRVFLDGKRMLHAPRMEAEMNILQIIGGRPNSARPNSDAFMRNFILTEGGGPIYQQIVEQGKFVTNEIQFDVNKADIKPESSTVIQVVFEMLQSHPDLKFSIEGHTDSDGDAALNQGLSQARAESVMRRLIEMGVTPDRLTAKGWGASKPVADNASADGKALNRRVEFVKM